MNRLILKKLESWKTDRYRKPLLLRGARQVGKTYVVEEFAREHFPSQFIKFDFEESPLLRNIFEEDLTPANIIRKLETFSNRSIADGETLVFFDEIQACPSALQSLRYFFEQRPELFLIAAGSLLEFALKDISFPVGRVDFLNIYPMTFEEFLLACAKDKIVEIVNARPEELSETEHSLVLAEFVNYLAVGGLPEAVKVYSETNSTLRALQIQKNLALLYEADFAKYAGKASLECLRQVFRATPAHLTKPLKYSHLTQDFTVPTIKNAVDLLAYAQVIKKVPSVNPHGLPLGASASAKLFKLLLADIGLLHGLSGGAAEIPMDHRSILDSYRGALAEQAVGQALCVQTDGEVYTWYRPEAGSQAEVDFIVSKNRTLIPVEVKSGAVGRLKSLHIFLKEHQLAEKGVVFSTSRYQEDKHNRITFLPIYYLDHFLRWV